MDISIKRILLGTLLGVILLIGYVQTAFAQTVNIDACTGLAPPPGTIETDFATTGGNFACMPSVGGGTGVGFTVRTNLSGVTVYFHCPQADGSHKTQIAAATWARLSTGDLKADTPMGHPTMTPVWCPWRDEARASRPTADVWKVAPNSANPSRPTYAFKDGVRTKYTYTNDPRVNVGVLCDYSVHVVEGSVTYAQVLPGRVAVCVK